MKVLQLQLTDKHHQIMCNIRARLGLPDVPSVAIRALSVLSKLSEHIASGGKIILIGPDDENPQELILENGSELLDDRLSDEGF